MEKYKTEIPQYPDTENWPKYASKYDVNNKQYWSQCNNEGYHLFKVPKKDWPLYDPRGNIIYYHNYGIGYIGCPDYTHKCKFTTYPISKAKNNRQQRGSFEGIPLCEMQIRKNMVLAPCINGFTFKQTQIYINKIDTKFNLKLSPDMISLIMCSMQKYYNNNKNQIGYFLLATLNEILKLFSQFIHNDTIEIVNSITDKHAQLINMINPRIRIFECQTEVTQWYRKCRKCHKIACYIHRTTNNRKNTDSVKITSTETLCAIDISRISLRHQVIYSLIYTFGLPCGIVDIIMQYSK